MSSAALLVASVDPRAGDTSPVFGWHRFWDETHRLAPEILATGIVPGPPAGPFVSGAAYPLAVDVDGCLGAVSFAALDPYPDIEDGWWCVAMSFTLIDGAWTERSQHDNLTQAQPFSRPLTPDNSRHDWCDWHTNGPAGLGDEEDEHPWRHGFFGVAPVGTARLTVTDEAGRERDLRITPWNGAYVAEVAGLSSTLTGYGADGRPLGSLMPVDGLDEEPIVPEPPPGLHRVENTGGSLVFEKDEPE
jgi:hypothetical protein